MKVEIDGKIVAVHVRCDSWDEAWKAVQEFRAEPPDGYKLIGQAICPRTREDGSFIAGRKCNLEIRFVHCNRHVDQFTKSEAYEFFQAEELEPSAR